MLKFRTKDHPEANGRQPRPNDKEWAFKFPLDNGRTLLIEMGDEGLKNLRQIVLDQLIDEKKPKKKADSD